MTIHAIPLSKLPVGYSGIVFALSSTERVRRRMLDLGLIGGTNVQSLRRSPSGDPTAYEIRGAVIALRSGEADQVWVLPVNREN
ncbi:MAG: FeoA family protein [Bacillota bacterium]|nr:FeoA family protein [Bacillota bacterium]